MYILTYKNVYADISQPLLMDTQQIGPLARSVGPTHHGQRILVLDRPHCSRAHPR